MELARFFAAPSAANAYPFSEIGSSQLIWGNQRVQGGRLTPGANGWAVDVLWGAVTTRDGQNITWGVTCPGANCDEGGGSWVPWGVGGDSDNVVWADTCGGADCLGGNAGTAGTTDFPPGTPSAATVVWGTANAATVVWGTADAATVVWGTADDDTAVWGTRCEDESCSTLWSGQ